MAEPLKMYEVMVEVPSTIESSATLTEAMDAMKRQGIRHLPVLKDGELIGMVSDRDLKYSLRYPVPSDSMVEHIMVRDLFVVDPEATVAEVALAMADRRYGSAIVQASDGRVVGIFTTTDALKLLGTLIREGGQAA